MSCGLNSGVCGGVTPSRRVGSETRSALFGLGPRTPIGGCLFRSRRRVRVVDGAWTRVPRATRDGVPAVRRAAAQQRLGQSAAERAERASIGGLNAAADSKLAQTKRPPPPKRRPHRLSESAHGLAPLALVHAALPDDERPSATVADESDLDGRANNKLRAQPFVGHGEVPFIKEAVAVLAPLGGEASPFPRLPLNPSFVRSNLSMFPNWSIDCAWVARSALVRMT